MKDESHISDLILPMTTVGKADRSIGMRGLGEVESGKQATIRKNEFCLDISSVHMSHPSKNVQKIV